MPKSKLTISVEGASAVTIALVVAYASSITGAFSIV